MKSQIWRTLLLLLVVLWLLAACSSSAEEQKVAAGREVYIANCSHCHQLEGQGYAQIYPPLAGNPIVTLHNSEPTIEIVLHGRGAMPSFYDELTVEERAQVISYIRSAWGNNASTISTSQAQ
jgi:mono/diheme cytochrome c family protein